MKNKMYKIIQAGILVLLCGCLIIGCGSSNQSKKDSDFTTATELALENAAINLETEEALEEPKEAAIVLTNLRINFQENPIGLGSRELYFSWELQAKETEDRKSVSQKGYRIVLLEEDQCIWDSDYVESNATANIYYDGSALKDHGRYVAKVTAYDENGMGTVPAETTFSMAYIEQPVFADAKFITYGDGESEEGITSLYKTIKVEDKPIKYAYLHGSCLGVYEAYLNGQRVSEDYFKPGWSDYNDTLFYNTFDITDMLEKKENHFIVSIANGWWAGRNSFETYGKHRPAFIGEIFIGYEDGTTTKVSTDLDWTYEKDTAIRFADFYDGETVDYHKAFPKEQSKNGLQAGKPVTDSTLFKGKFVAFTGYGAREIQELNRMPERIWAYSNILENGSTYGKADLKECSLHNGLVLQPEETLLVDLGQNMTGVPEITFQTTEGGEVSITFAEMLNDTGEKSKGNDGPADTLYRANYRSAKTQVRIIQGEEAEHTYRPLFFYTGFRYFTVNVTKETTIKDVRGIVITNSSPRIGFLETNHEKINKLYNNVLWSQYNNFMLVATDCPQRDERLGWTGDLNSFANTSMYNQDLYTFYEKWATDLRDGQSKEGAIYDTIPRVKIIGKGNAGWAEASILVPINVYRKYGNISYLEKCYPVMEKYMEYLESRSDFNTLDKVGPGLAYGDWLAKEKTHTPFLAAMWYCLDAKEMAYVADLLNKPADKEKYENLEKRILEYLQSYIVPRLEAKSFTQTEMVFLLHYHFLKAEQVEPVKTMLAESVEKNEYKLMTGFAGTPIILQTLCDEGMQDLAYQILLGEKNPSWMYSILQSATTIWERYDSYTIENGFQDAAMNSFDHFNEGSVAQFMYESMLGIQIDHTKEYTINIHPYFPDADTGIDQAKGSVHSIYGEIAMEWERSGNNICGKVSIPHGKNALFTYPDGREEVIVGEKEFLIRE